MLGNESPIASAVGEILPHNEWYDFEAKYVEGGSDIVIPARLTRRGDGRHPADVARRLRGLRPGRPGAHRLLPRADGAIVLNEINTMPGFTATSVYASLFAASGVPYPALLTA